MNSIACATSTEATERVRHAIERSSRRCVTLTSPAAPATLLAGIDTNSVVGVATAEHGCVVAMGSGLRRLADDPDDAARSLLASLGAGTGSLLDALCADLVAMAITPDGAVVLATREGQQRLYRCVDDDVLVAASEVGLVAAGIGARASIDRGYEDFLLSYAFLPDGHTPCRGVDAVPVGTVTRHGPDGSGPAEGSSAPPRARTATNDGTTDSPHDALYALLLEIVAEQAGDAPTVGVLLGGVDSALVAALLHRLGHRVHTFTFEFEDAKYNQRNVEPVRREIADDHTWVPITVDVIADGLRRYGDVYNQPVAQPHYLLHTLAASEAIARAGLTQAFSGDGADAAFLGYPTVNQRARLLDRAGRVPLAVRRAVTRVISAPSVELRLGHSGRKMRAVLEQAAAEGAARGHLPTPVFDATARERLRADDPPQTEPIDAVRKRLAAGVAGLDLARLALHGHALIGQSRVKVEGAVAATGVAQSSPFVDERLRDFAAALDPSVLRTLSSRAGGPGKQLMLEMIEQHELLPHEVIHQAKQSPVDAPIDAWYAGPLRDLVLDTLQSLPFDWNRDYVDQLLDGAGLDRWYRERVASLGHHILQPIGLLCSYASCSRRIMAAR